jgi:hypothetical protein
MFCGGRPLTKEHVIPKWLSTVVIPERQFIVIDGVRTTIGKEPIVARRVNRYIDFLARQVCGPCNNGWMADLEAKVQPLLTPMIHGDARTLSRDDQGLLAAWATKTALVFQYELGSKEPSPERRRRWMYMHRLPTPDSAVWIAAYGGDASITAVIANQIRSDRYSSEQPPEAQRPDTQFMTLSIGRFVVQVLFMIEDGRMHLRVPPAFQPHVIPVWPRVQGVSDVVDWPPPLMNDEQLDAFENLTVNRIAGRPPAGV